MTYSVAVVGLGAMGMGAALSCVKAGLDTYGVDLDDKLLEKLKNAGAKGVAKNAGEFADKLNAVVLLVVNAKQVNQVLFGDNGLAVQLKPGTAVMVSSTISVQDQYKMQKKFHKN